MIVVLVWLAGLTLFVGLRLRATKPGTGTASARRAARSPRTGIGHEARLRAVRVPRAVRAPENAARVPRWGGRAALERPAPRRGLASVRALER
jgi:hypothetical protein